ncbi:acyl-CoA N-acyltransferase, partial [Teratosphaeria nubilosa]
MANVWRSERLVYRAIEAEDEPFLSSIQADPESWLNGTPRLPVPQGKARAKRTRDGHEKCMLAVAICLAAPQPTQSDIVENIQPVPIGTLKLRGEEPFIAHHRHASLGISILRAYHGQGYGSEAVKWALRWGFRWAGLHRIELAAFEWDSGAIRLYERLGFVHEGRKRDLFWFDGRFWDLVQLAMLEHEWRALYG